MSMFIYLYALTEAIFKSVGGLAMVWCMVCGITNIYIYYKTYTP